jgi:hypothetical protein
MTQPIPPPSVKPPTPVCEMWPKGIVNALGLAASAMSLRSAPPPTRAVRVAGSTLTELSSERSIVIPPSAIEWPAMLWAPQRIAISSPASRAARIAHPTSSSSAGRTISSGRWSIALFQSVRAAPYRRSSGRTMSPENRSSKAVLGWRMAGVELMVNSPGCWVAAPGSPPSQPDTSGNSPIPALVFQSRPCATTVSPV